MVTVHARTFHRPRAVRHRQPRRVLRQKPLRTQLVRRSAGSGSADNADGVPRLADDSGRAPFPRRHLSVVCHKSALSSLPDRLAIVERSDRQPMLGCVKTASLRKIFNDFWQCVRQRGPAFIPRIPVVRCMR